MWIFLWVLKFPLSANFFVQMSHSYGLSPVWRRIWIFKVLERMKDWSQTVHLNGLSPVCRLKWSDRCPCVVKDLPQSLNEHMNGFSPLWMRMCVLRLPFSVNFLPQPFSGHTKGLRPLYRIKNASEIFPDKGCNMIPIWLFTYMCTHMNFETTSSWITFPTDATFERLLTSMD